MRPKWGGAKQKKEASVFIEYLIDLRIPAGII
jgi:hypothetical protein